MAKEIDEELEEELLKDFSGRKNRRPGRAIGQQQRFGDQTILGGRVANFSGLARRTSGEHGPLDRKPFWSDPYV